ncbi:MAG: 3-deoxy-7-phosphoheptulonate synthase [Candidatus Dasytiphilus stammeri]
MKKINTLMSHLNEKVILTPEQLKELYPCNERLQKQIAASRQTISSIIKGSDDRFLLVCGPCSIHDTKVAMQYACHLKKVADQIKDRIYLVMRVYFEKPRTTIGWKGFINDPYIDNSFDIETGLKIARHLLLELSQLGIPLATETLNPYTPAYLADLFSWMAIGARTTESQTHREIASGLSMPVGFKNSTHGNLDTAINAIITSAIPHCFVSISQKGRVCLLQTPGNPDGHIILRGGITPNYDSQSISKCEHTMIQAGLYPAIMVDCSHDNSNKDYRQQPKIAKSVVIQRKIGNRSIIGLMLESNLYEGNQPFEPSSKGRRYGVSLTDACISWETTEALLKELYKELS